MCMYIHLASLPGSSPCTHKVEPGNEATNTLTLTALVLFPPGLEGIGLMLTGKSSLHFTSSGSFALRYTHAHAWKWVMEVGKTQALIKGGTKGPHSEQASTETEEPYSLEQRVSMQWYSLVPRPHLLAGRNGLVNEVEFLGLEAHYGMYNHCVTPVVLSTCECVC